VRLIEQDGVSVHPGYFFGFEGQGWLVVSLLAKEAEFKRGAAAIGRVFGEE